MNKDSKKYLVPKLRFPEFRNTGGWEDKLLSEAALVIAGQSPDGSYYNEIGEGVPFYQGKTDFGEIYLNPPTKWTTQVTKLANKGDILMSVRAPVGALNIATDNVCIGRGLAAIQTNQNRWFLYYFLSSNQKYIIGNGGSIFDSINKEQIEKLSIKIPFNIKEQQKIANCLSSIDELITAQSQKLDALKAHKKGLMQQLFPAEGETVPKLRFKGFKGEWEEKTIGQVANYENGKAHEQDIKEVGDFIVVNSKFISTDGVVKKFTNSAFCIAKKEDILMVLSDVPNGRAIAKCFFVDTDNIYTVNQRICKLTPTGAVGLILFYVLNRNPYFLAFDDGVKQTNLKKEDVVDCPILLPKDPKEQQKIADCLSSIDKLITAQSEKLDVLKLHKKGLMQGMFPNNFEGANNYLS